MERDGWGSFEPHRWELRDLPPPSLPDPILCRAECCGHAPQPLGLTFYNSSGHLYPPNLWTSLPPVPGPSPPSLQLAPVWAE